MNQPVPQEHLRHRLEAYVRSYPETTGEQNIWRTPLLVTAGQIKFKIIQRSE